MRHWRSWPLVASVVVLAGVTLSGAGAPAPSPVFVPVADAAAYDSTGWQFTATSEGDGDPASDAGDLSNATVWESAAGAGLPQALTIDTGSAREVGGLRYTPPALGSTSNIGAYRVEVSDDAQSWASVGTGAWADDATVKTAQLTPVSARFVRLVALSNAGSGDRVAAAEVELLSPAAAQASGPPPHADWLIAVDSAQPSAAGTRAIDGDRATAWKSDQTAFPHTATIDTGSTGTYSGLKYVPPTDGGTILSYRVEVSSDNDKWTTVTSGTWADDTDTKTTTFSGQQLQYVRLVALSGSSGYAGAAELDLIPGQQAPDEDPTKGKWTPPVNFPIVPAAVSLLPNGLVLAWSADSAVTYGGDGGKTHTVIYNPTTGAMAHVVVTNTGQDMFCPGIALLPDGRVMVSGGHIDSSKVSIYDAAKNAWTAGKPMRVTRGYQSTTTLGDGTVFILGGSWGDTNTVKNGELWNETTGSRYLSRALVRPMLTHDAQGVYRADNHAWLFTWGSRVFQAGPSRRMNWYSTQGPGDVRSAGNRGTDGDAMNGAAVMYAPGKILTLGGAPDYVNAPATANANSISITNDHVVVTPLSQMHYPRSFASAVVLPDGKVFVAGGMELPKTFSDATAVLTPELWDPATRQFTEMADMQVPRTYHSVALLLPDARVLVGGGGLCGTIGECEDATHADAQTWTPPYLLNPDGSLRARPVITAAPATATLGGKLVVRTSAPVTSMSLIRVSAVTHSVNTDQRRIPVPFTGSPTGYTIPLPSDRSTLVPGAYMLFVTGSSGAPSVARIITIR